MHILIWILTGLLVGWATRIVTRRRRLGLMGDLTLGLLGGVGGGWLFRLADLTRPEPGPGHVAAAIGGAAAVISGTWLLVRSTDRAAARPPAAAPAVQTLEAQLSKLGEIERSVIDKVLRRERIARNTNLEFEQQLTVGERMADRIAFLGGSWAFIGFFAATLIVWTAYNVEWPQGFDPYPFILLNLVLSCLAALQAPIILMTQNRLASKDRLDAHHDYEVNLKAETEIMELNAKLDELLQREWKRLLDLQAHQIEALARIERRLELADKQGVSSS